MEGDARIRCCDHVCDARSGCSGAVDDDGVGEECGVGEISGGLEGGKGNDPCAYGEYEIILDFSCRQTHPTRLS